jgi:hypothetical protein
MLHAEGVKVTRKWQFWDLGMSESPQPRGCDGQGHEQGGRPSYARGKVANTVRTVHFYDLLLARIMTLLLILHCERRLMVDRAKRQASARVSSSRCGWRCEMFEAVATPAGSHDAGGRCKQREHLPELRSSIIARQGVQIHKIRRIAEGF